MPDFRKARVGDKCYHLLFGECYISEVKEDRVHVRRSQQGFTEIVRMDGRSAQCHAGPILYHAKPEISDPPPPKRKVKKTVWQNFYRMRQVPDDLQASDVFNTEDGAKRYASTGHNFVGTFPTEIEYEEE